MNKAALCVFMLLAAPSLSFASLTESWYLSRGQANMQIGNHKAAIEAYEKVLGQDPENTEAMRNLGIAYEAQGLKDKSVAQYDRYLERHPDDYEIAFKQADTLGWSRYAYRKQDALKYYRMGLKRKNDYHMRLKYARLLASNRETSSLAIEQYKRVIASDPHSAEAHRGLARAYAWNGQNDQALYESQLAMRYDGNTADLTKLERDLNQGREPTLGGGARFVDQSGTNFALDGVEITVRGRRDVSPFVTLRAEAGYEDYWSSTQSAAGALFRGGGEFRLDPSQRIDAELGYLGFGKGSSPQEVSGGDFVFNFEYVYDAPDYSVKPGFKRDLRYDSLLALVGQGTGAGTLGAARSNVFFVEYDRALGSFQFKATPYMGWVSMASLAPNSELGTDLRAEVPITGVGELTLSAAYVAQVLHYGEDQSGFVASTVAPLPGGYFSPSFFWSQSPELVFKAKVSESSELDLNGGPALQFVNDTADPGVWRIGGEADTALRTRFAPRFEWQLGGGFVQVADIYRQYRVNSFLSYRF